jgi:hypothetical protein
MFAKSTTGGNMSSISTTGNYNPTLNSISSVHTLNDDVLHYLVSFLDFNSVNIFRLVCTRWALLALPHLNSRGYFCIAQGYQNNEDVDYTTNSTLDFKQAASKYSSLKFELTYLLAAYPMQINEPDVWKHIQSLHITLPLTRERTLWIYKLISSLCSPNLSELTISFSKDDDHHPLSKQMDWDSHLALQNKPNVSFPKLPDNPHIKSLTFEGIHNHATSYFASHLISSSCNLRRLSFIDCQYTPRLHLFEHLIRAKVSLRKLECFKIDMERMADEVEPGSRREPSYNHIENGFILTLRDLQEDFQLPFGKNLKSLVWHVPFARENKPDSFQLLPGILTKSVTSSLVKLQLDCAVYDFDKDSYHDTQDYPKCLPISFPCFENLRDLTLGNHACYTLALSDFVDAAPNLHTLSIWGPNCLTLLHQMRKSGRLKMLKMLWRKTHRSSNLPHNKLQELTIDMPIEDISSLRKFMRKFPNVEQLDVGNVSSDSMDDFLTFLSPKLPNLKRLFWVYEERGLTLQALFDHIVRIPTRLPNIEYYFVKRYQGFAKGQEEEDLKELLPSLLPITQKDHRGIILPSIILHFRKFCCLHKDEDRHVCPKNCVQSKIHYFIQQHQLPIQIRVFRQFEGACTLPT